MSGIYPLLKEGFIGYLTNIADSLRLRLASFLGTLIEMGDKMQDKLIDFIRDEFLDDPDTELDIDTKLISSGMIDSFSLVSLQRFIEQEFGKKIPAPRITAQSFDTVRQMIQIIEQF